ncbi:hypothetical protein Tco_0971599 [Tanacetum coccineum]
MSLEAHQEKGEGEVEIADMERAIKLSLDPAFLPQGQAPVGGVTIRDQYLKQLPNCQKYDKYQGKKNSSTVTSGASIPVSVPEKAHEALAGPDPEPMQENQTGSNSGKLHVSSCWTKP